MEHFETLRNHEVLPGDLIIASLGEVLPRAAIVPDLKAPAIVKADVIRARIHSEISSKWVLYALQSPQARRYAASRIKGVGRPRLGLGEIRRIPIPLPPAAEQRRIVEALDDLVSRLDVAEVGIARSLERSDHAWASVLNSVARGDLGGRSVQADLCLVSEVAEVRGGIQKQQKRRPVENFFPFLRVANVARGKLQLDEIHQIELFAGELDRYRLTRGDLLVVEGNGSPDQIGRAATWRGQIENAVHQNHLIRVRPGGELLPRYVELVWNSPLVVDQLREVAKSTSGLYTLSTAKVKSVKIPVPALSDQQSLVEGADAWESSIGAARATLQAARVRSRLLRQSALERAISGRLVPQNSVDESAVEILERIRSERQRNGKQKPSRVRRARSAGASAGNLPAAPSAITPIPGTAVQQEFEL
ncbi:restriction endonuclease subunit S [Streptomyces sp. DT224]|uniref:restriction endonuclease subunit S n=1 Tax=Streptomyces sp. DT224 TaxID=3393426 RepID=UPI003CEFCCDF